MDARARAEFEEFVTARSAALFRTAVLLTGNRQDAQDLVQSALERAWRHWGRVAAAEQPEAYVRRILVNSLRDRWLIRKRIVEVPFDDTRLYFFSAFREGNQSMYFDIWMTSRTKITGNDKH